MPKDNAFVESLNRRVRDEYLNQSGLRSLQGARKAIKAWREDHQRSAAAQASGRPQLDAQTTAGTAPTY